MAQGKVRAKQDTGKGTKQALCIMVHGDAAMTAQGVVSETLVLSNLPEYTVGTYLRLNQASLLTRTLRRLYSRGGQ